MTGDSPSSSSNKRESTPNINPNQRLSSALLNEFATYLQQKQVNNGSENTTTMLCKFAEFLAKSNKAPTKDIPGIICAISTALELSKNMIFG
jgi:hypothetical protein